MTNSGTLTPHTPQAKTFALDSTPLWRNKTQAWIETQGVWRSRSYRVETRDWIWHHYLKEAEEFEAEKRLKQKEAERRWWEATAASIDRQARQWMDEAEAARRNALLEAEKTKKLQEEIRRTKDRTEAKGYQKREMKEATMMSDGEDRVRKQRKRDHATKRLLEAWDRYQNRWATLTSSSSLNERLTFRTIPWPLISIPSSLSSIVPENIAFFLLSDLHSKNKTRRERLLEAMQRWHNDKFEPKILPRVAEEDRSTVKDGVDIVVRCLNELLRKQ